MFERFTDRARRVIVLAQEEARALQHNYIGTEHLLLGLIREGEGVGTQVLIKMDVDLGELRSATIDMIRGNSGTGTGDGKGDLANAGGVTDESHTAAVIKGQAQTPLKQVAVTVPSISFTHIDNSSYVARHYSEDLTTEKFISLVGESARTIAAENDLYASVMIAPAILESASGNSTLAQAPNNNLFGIKGTYHGNWVQLLIFYD